MLEIKNLHARNAEDGTEIIRGLNLTVKAGEVAAIMGPKAEDSVAGSLDLFLRVKNW